MQSNDSVSTSFANLSVSEQHASGKSTPQISTPTLSQVSSTRDTITDTDHKRLDNAILETFELSIKYKISPKLKLLLFSIVNDDDRLINLSNEKAEAMLAQEPNLGPLLQAAWASGSFKEIRKLGL